MTPADPSVIIAAARGWLGTPYHDQASLKGAGVDCLGLARGVWREVVGREPEPVPPYTPDWGEVTQREVLKEAADRWMIPQPVTAAGPGSLVLFRMVRRSIAKHVGILTGPATFIHAYSGRAVEEEALTQAWQRRIAFAYQFPAAP